MRQSSAVAFLLLFAPLRMAAASEAYFKIDGMKSASCESEVASALKSVRGVSQVEVSRNFGGAWVEYSGTDLNVSKLAAKISAAGYRGVPIAPEKAKAIIESVRAGEEATRKKATNASPGVRNGALPPWEPVDDTFRGCEGGCGLRGENHLAVVQPGAKLGQLAYCPVSGVVFEVKESTPKADVNGKPVYFCCEGCARHFAVARDEVLSKRRLRAAK